MYGVYIVTKKQKCYTYSFLCLYELFECNKNNVCGRYRRCYCSTILSKSKFNAHNVETQVAMHSMWNNGFADLETWTMWYVFAVQPMWRSVHAKTGQAAHDRFNHVGKQPNMDGKRPRFITERPIPVQENPTTLLGEPHTRGPHPVTRGPQPSDGGHHRSTRGPHRSIRGPSL